MAILVVDDAEEIREIFAVVLAEGGYRDVIALDSALAAFSFLAFAKAPSIELMFLDIVMPGIDGIQACARVRSDSRYADVPIVMTTSIEDIASMDRAFQYGATDFLTKPLKAIDILACVRSKTRLKADLEQRSARERELMQHVPFQF